MKRCEPRIDFSFFQLIIAIAITTSVLLIATLPIHVKADEVRIPFGNITLSANLELAEGKTLTDGLVLITHGTLGHSKMELIATLQNLLNEAGHSSLAINLGLGLPDREFMYECPTPHRHIFHDAMAEIRAWLDWLISHRANGIVLFGHSRGGNQTAWFSAENKVIEVDKIILLAPSTWDQRSLEANYKKRHRQSLTENLAKAKALVAAGNGGKMMDNTGMLYCQKVSVSAESFVSYYLPDQRHDTPSLLNKITKPMLIIAGSDDTVVSDLPSRITKRLKNNNHRFELVDGAGHFFRDLYAEDVADLIVQFIEE